MSCRLPPVCCPYLEIMEQQKQYAKHAKRVVTARPCVDSYRPSSPQRFSYYLKKLKDTDKKVRLKKPRQIKSARGPPKTNLRPDDWMTQLNDVILPPQGGTKVSPSAILLFPSPMVPNTRTPETLRRIIDDSGMKVLDESPLSARDSYYAKDIESMMIKPPGPAFHVRPSPRPKSMRRPERAENAVPAASRPKVAQSERQQRPEFVFTDNEDDEENAKQVYEEQKKKFDELNLDDFDLDKYNVDMINLDHLDQTADGEPILKMDGNIEKSDEFNFVDHSSSHSDDNLINTTGKREPVVKFRLPDSGNEINLF